MVAWDPRGYGHSRPPDRDFPGDFFERDAKDAVDLMKVGLLGKSLREGEWLDLSFILFLFLISIRLILCGSYRKILNVQIGIKKKVEISHNPTM